MRTLPTIALVTAGASFALLLAACEPYAPNSAEQRELHPIEPRPPVHIPVQWERIEHTDETATDAEHPAPADPHGEDAGHDAPAEHSAAEVWRQVGQVAAGAVTGDAIEQPIAFTHYRHVTVLGMDCQYCHAYGRDSNVAGVPPVEMCMGCHTHVRTDSPEIMKLTEFWEADEPVPWQKVHDLPDFVYFAHKRHIRAGVQCTECHGQVPLMGRWPDGDPARAEVMVRETTLQMGWCLDCHAEHPSIDEHYGEDAPVRRAELKDCWTCHK